MQDINQKLSLTNKEILKSFYPYLLIGLVVIVSLLSLAYKNQGDYLISIAETREEIRISDYSETMGEILDLVYSDIYIIRDYLLLAPLSPRYFPGSLLEAEQLFLSFSTNKKVYDQIRYIDQYGLELIRVNNSGRAVLVSEKDLQDKSNRYYFLDIMNLNNGEIFISPLDLNIERGEIEIPKKPMLRIGTPVEKNGVKYGIVLLNYLPSEILKHFGRFSDYTGWHGMLLTNSEGYQLVGPDSARNWELMLYENDNKNYLNTHSDEWSKVNSSINGQFRNDEGIYTFDTVFPLNTGMISSTGSPEAFKPSDFSISESNYYWKMISFVPFKSIFSPRLNLLKRIIGIGTFLICSLFITGYLLTRNILLNIAAQKKIELNQIELEKQVLIRTNSLKERVKELRFLYNTTEVAAKPGITLDELYRDFVSHIPQGWQYPEITGGCIRIGKKVYKTNNFKKTRWIQKENINVEDEIIGTIEVCYLQEKPDEYEGPFLKEEREVLKNFSKLISGHITRKLAEEHQEQAMIETQKANKVKELFLANMSHEIRTPLNTILGFTELIEESTKDVIGEEEKEFFKVINSSGQRLMNTVHKILDISQIEAGTYDINMVDINLVDLVQKLLDGFQILVAEKKLKLEFHSIPKEALIYGDWEGIFQSISNIVENAIKYTEKGRITLSLKQKSGCAILIIKDTGIGMSREYLEILFEDFTQESEGYTKKFQGIGLGMAIAKRHLELNRVKIVVDSSRGKGTTITLTFPNPAKDNV